MGNTRYFSKKTKDLLSEIMNLFLNYALRRLGLEYFINYLFELNINSNIYLIIIYTYYIFTLLILKSFKLYIFCIDK